MVNKYAYEMISESTTLLPSLQTITEYEIAVQWMLHPLAASVRHHFSLCLCFLSHPFLHFFPLFSVLSSFQYPIIIICKELCSYTIVYYTLQLSSLLSVVPLLLLHLFFTISKIFVIRFLDFLHYFCSYFTILYQKDNLVIIFRYFFSE